MKNGYGHRVWLSGQLERNLMERTFFSHSRAVCGYFHLPYRIIIHNLTL
jgi:hypothetical protein